MKEDKQLTKPKAIRLYRHQEEYAEDKSLNLSKHIRKLIDDDIKRDKNEPGKCEHS